MQVMHVMQVMYVMHVMHVLEGIGGLKNYKYFVTKSGLNFSNHFNFCDSLLQIVSLVIKWRNVIG